MAEAAQPPHLVRPGRVREIVTPDGVALTVRIADLGARLGAALIDLSLIAVSVMAFAIFGLILFSSAGEVILEISILALFLARVFYFPYFEMAWGGRTPGKLAIGLRVIDRNGAGLTGEAVLARNLVREVEFFLPVMTVLSRPDLTGNVWANLAAYGFIFLVISLPLLNRERMRGGDILAGTWVVFEERATLIPDLARRGAATEGYSFTDAQLRTYGLKELETLAAVLRDRSAKAPELRRKVAETIQRKIQYDAAPGEKADDFLAAFYASLRGALERRKAATGYAPEDKHAAPAGRRRRSEKKRGP